KPPEWPTVSVQPRMTQGTYFIKKGNIYHAERPERHFLVWRGVRRLGPSMPTLARAVPCRKRSQGQQGSTSWHRRRGANHATVAVQASVLGAHPLSGSPHPPGTGASGESSAPRHWRFSG